MLSFFRLVGPNQAVEVFGIRMVGVNAENGAKLLLTLAFIGAVLLLGWGLRVLARHLRRRLGEKAAFWLRQGINVFVLFVLLVGLASIWFDDPVRLATALGLLTAGLAFALQRVVTALAGYLVILRGKVFSVGDRISMGGVRGDVIALGFVQTTIMEMGEPPRVSTAEPPVWVQSRQYTGRVVTVSNDKIFDQPVYNYTRDFPYIWEELSIPIRYGANHRQAERILLDAAEKYTVAWTELSDDALREMRRRYFVKTADMHARVYYRLTDNWLELTVRFITQDSGIREVKDAMSREILRALESAGIQPASTTFELTAVPPLRIRQENHSMQVD